MQSNNYFNFPDDKFDLDFLIPSSKSKSIKSLKSSKSYKILIADDDEDIHTLTNILLKDFSFENSKLTFIHTYSTMETLKALDQNSDIAVIILDVVMEEMNSGLEIIDYIRKIKLNKNIRIILRTGQPGYAPEESLIKNYDINDYKLKTELTKQKLFTAMYSCLRSYRDLIEIEKTKKSLEHLVKVSGYLFAKKSINDFLNSIFDQIEFFESCEHSVSENKNLNRERNGLIITEKNEKYQITGGIGKYKNFKEDFPTNYKIYEEIFSNIKSLKFSSGNSKYFNGNILFICNNFSSTKNYIIVEMTGYKYNRQIIELLLNNHGLALENYQLNKMILRNQEDIIFTLTETIERHSNETSNHVKRVSLLMNLICEKYGLSKAKCELLSISSVLHDIGKIGIPDYILKKPEKLNYKEFEIIKTHAEIGYEILKNNNHPCFKLASEIAYYHHEKYDGTGYPNGLSGEKIPVYARMMSIIDVFDALLNKRCYKDAFPLSKVIEIMNDEKGKHFDPYLLDLFMKNLDEVMEIMSNYND